MSSKNVYNFFLADVIFVIITSVTRLYHFRRKFFVIVFLMNELPFAMALKLVLISVESAVDHRDNVQCNLVTHV